MLSSLDHDHEDQIRKEDNMAKQTLEEYAQENPAHHHPKHSFLEKEELKDLVDEAVNGVRSGISPTVASRWLVENSPIEVKIKINTIRMWLSNRAKENA